MERSFSLIWFVFYATQRQIYTTINCSNFVENFFEIVCMTKQNNDFLLWEKTTNTCLTWCVQCENKCALVWDVEVNWCAELLKSICSRRVCSMSCVFQSAPKSQLKISSCICWRRDHNNKKQPRILASSHQSPIWLLNFDDFVDCFIHFSRKFVKSSIVTMLCDQNRCIANSLNYLVEYCKHNVRKYMPSVCRKHKHPVSQYIKRNNVLSAHMLMWIWFRSEIAN